MPEYSIKPVTRMDCASLVLQTHYARRWPSFSWAYGLFLGDELRGVVLYGRPSMMTVRVGLAGPENEREVWELTRLVLTDNARNEASRLVSGSLRALVKDLGKEGAIILSFADPEYGHHGGIYQACSFLYQGMSAKRWHWQFVAGPNVGKHCATVVGEFKGQKNRRELLKEKYGDDVQWVPRPRKHRYVKVVGSKGYRKKKTRELRYKEKDYPKE